MRKEKILQKIKEKNSNQVDKYFKAVQKVVINNPEYYYKKDYAEKFK